MKERAKPSTKAAREEEEGSPRRDGVARKPQICSVREEKAAWRVLLLPESEEED